MSKKYLYLLFLGLSLTSFSKESTKKITQTSACEEFKEAYISYIKDIFYVTKTCKRRFVDQEEAKKITRAGNQVHQVAKEVIQVLPREKRKETYTFTEMRKKYQSQCVSAGKVVYLVTSMGKRAYFSYDVAKKACRGKITQVSYPELRAMPDLTPFSRPKGLYPPLKTGTTPKKISLSKACAKLKDGSFATFHSKIYKVKRDKKNICYLIEADPRSHSVRMALGDAPPVDLTPSQFVSLRKEELPPKEQTKKPSHKG